MFEIKEFYKLAHSGKQLTAQEREEVIAYIQSFAHVIIWGGSYLGTALGKCLIDQGVHVDTYWDMRCEELRKVNDISVKKPFSDKAQDDVLVIFCIGNNVIRANLLSQLKINGYSHVLRGDYLYEGLVCPFDISTGIQSKECQGSMCCRAMFCQRLENIVKKGKNTEHELSVYHVTLTINQRCSLKCKCCTSYMNEYPLDKQINFSLEQIENDIDVFFDAVDSVGSVTVMGGEPFMHPDLAKIIQKLLEKENLGLICIATTGTYPIKEEQLDGLTDDRVNVSFSNYEQSITDNQKKMMYESIRKVKEAGVAYTVGVYMPEWIVPSTLYKQNVSEEILIQKKNACTHPPRCMMIKNGKLHPCDFAAAVYHLGIAEYPNDYVQMDKMVPNQEMKECIRSFMQQPYYEVCGHCHYPGLSSPAAEQGYMDFKKPIKQGDV